MCNVNFDWNNVPAYEWDGETEVQTISSFKTLSQQLTSALAVNDNDRQREDVKQAIGKILDWGHISMKDGGIDEFVSAIIEMNQEYAGLQRNDVDFERKVTEILKRGRRENDWRISSWSKILAAWKPGVFFIYDSRVAIGLTAVYPDIKWTIPSARGKNSIFGFVSAEIKRETTLDMPSSYCKYLKIIQTLSGCTKINFKGFTDLQPKMAHVEKLLFMIPEMLTYHVQISLDGRNLPGFSCEIKPGARKNKNKSNQ